MTAPIWVAALLLMFGFVLGIPFGVHVSSGREARSRHATTVKAQVAEVVRDELAAARRSAVPITQPVHQPVPVIVAQVETRTALPGGNGRAQLVRRRGGA